MNKNILVYPLILFLILMIMSCRDSPKDPLYLNSDYNGTIIIEDPFEHFTDKSIKLMKDQIIGIGPVSKASDTVKQGRWLYLDSDLKVFNISWYSDGKLFYFKEPLKPGHDNYIFYSRDSINLNTLCPPEVNLNVSEHDSNIYFVDIYSDCYPIDLFKITMNGTFSRTRDYINNKLILRFNRASYKSDISLTLAYNDDNNNQIEEFSYNLIP